ncbi:MAG: hypothetical protein ACRDK0_15680 [Solirubrobacteraceae bacterium]
MRPEQTDERSRPALAGDAVPVGDWGGLAWTHLSRLLDIITDRRTVYLALGSLLGKPLVVELITAVAK